MKATKMTKKIFALVLSLVLALGMSATAFATGTNLNQIDSAQYTTFLDSGNTSVTLYATTTNTFADNVPFTTAAEANSVSWGWTEDGSTIVSNGSSPNGGDLRIASWGNIPIASLPVGITPYASPTPASGYYSFVTVVLDNLSANPGVYSIVGKMAGSFDINFTIGIESTSVQPDITGVDIRIVDATIPSTLYTTTRDIESIANIPTSLLFGQAAALQNDPSAMGTLQAMEDNGDILGFTVDPTAAYADTLDLPPVYGPGGAPTFPGWSYGVYRDDGLGNWVLDPLSQVVSASAFPLAAGDRVMWVYGPFGSVPGTW